MKNQKAVEEAKMRGRKASENAAEASSGVLRGPGRPKKEVKDRKVHVRLEPSVYQQLEAYALTQERSVSTLIRLWTTQRLKELNGDRDSRPA